MGKEYLYLAIAFFGLLCLHQTGVSAQCNSTGSNFIPAEKKLMKCLLSDYDNTVRPAKDAKDVVVVVLNMVLLKLIDLDEKNHKLVLNGWMHQRWNDMQLSWKPEDFGNIDSVRIPIEKIWSPDIVLYNNIADTWDFVVDKLAVVHSDGTVIWVPHAKLHSACKLDLHKFPYDTQVCKLFFGSWAYDLSKLDVQLANNHSNDFYMENDEWEVVSYKSDRKVLQYSHSEKYPEIILELGLKRRGTFHRHLFVVPGMLLAFLTLFIFLAPPESGERLSLGVGVIISVTLLMLLLEDYLPSEVSVIPIIGAYYTFIMVMATAAIVISIGVLNCHHRDIRKGKVPDLLRKIFLGPLSRWLCMKGDAYSAIPTDVSVPLNNTESSHVAQRMTALDGNSNTGQSVDLEKTLEEIRHYLKICASNSPHDQLSSHRQLVINEWHQLALVLDRLMFWIFVVLTLLVTIILFSA